jgi:hypothetical protein
MAKRKLTVESVDISTLDADPANVRKHDTRNLEAIRASLKRFGQQKPIVVDAKGVVVAGNGMLEAAKSLGWKKVNIVRTGLSGVEAAGYAIADNRTAELAEWDFEALATQLKGLIDDGCDVNDLGWSDHELEPMLAAEWSPPPVSDLPTAGGTGNGTSIVVTAEQRQTIDRATAKVRAREGDQTSEGRCVELICEEYLGE